VSFVRCELNHCTGCDAEESFGLQRCQDPVVLCIKSIRLKVKLFLSSIRSHKGDTEV